MSLITQNILQSTDNLILLKLTGLGVKWKLDRASNFRKSVSINF